MKYEMFKIKMRRFFFSKWIFMQTQVSIFRLSAVQNTVRYELERSNWKTQLKSELPFSEERSKMIKHPSPRQFDEWLPIIQQVPSYENICTEILDFDIR